MSKDNERSLRLTIKLQALQNAYCQGMAARLSEIGEIWTYHIEHGDTESFATVLNKVHMLSGTATMYGLKELGQIAETAENALLDLKDEAEPDALQVADRAVSQLLADRSAYRVEVEQ